MVRPITKVDSTLYRVDFDPHSTVEIGAGPSDDQSAGFLPHVKLKKWGDECWIKIKSRASYVANSPDEIGVGKIDKLEIADDTGDEATHIYPLDEGDGQELGGLELEAVKYKKPVSGPFIHQWDFEDSGNLEINYEDYKNLDLAKYSAEDLAAGVVRQEDDGGYDIDGKQIVKVPDWCVRSYSVRRKNTPFFLSGEAVKYKGGKVGHFRRPKATDKNGLWEWAELDINKQTGIVQVTCSQAFTDASVLPVKMDPTFGYTTLGATNFRFDPDIIGRALVSPASDGTVDSLHAGLDSTWDSGDEVKMALYTDIATPALQSPQSDTDSTGHGTAAFVSFNVTGTLNVVSSSQYIVVAWTNSTVDLRRDSGGTSGDSKYEANVTYGSWPSTLTESNSSNYYSTYATYSTGVAVTSWVNTSGEDAYHYPGKVNLAVVGTTFEATQGTGTVRLGNASTFGSVTTWDTLTVDSWSDTSIQVDIPVSLTNTLGPLWLYVTNDSGDSNNTGFACDVDNEWGQRYVEGTTTLINWCRVMSGDSPNVSGMTLDGVRIYVGATHTGQARLAVYQGATTPSSGPDGATLVEDLGLTTGSGTNQWLTVASGSNPTLDPNKDTWIAFKGNDNSFTMTYDGTTHPAGDDFYSARGRFATGGEVSSDETTGYPSTWPTDTGSFTSYWYGCHIYYSVSGDVPAAGTADAVTTAVGTASVSIAAVGTADAQATAVGVMEGTVPVSGTADALTTAVGTLTGTIAVSGTADALTTAVGTIEATVSVSGQADAAAGAVGTVTATVPVSGQADAQTTAVGTLTGTVPVSGTADAQATAVGTASVSIAAAGQADAQASAVGTVEATVPISGTADAQSTAVGTLTGDIAATGQSDAQSGAVGTLTGAIPVSGQADAQTTAVGTASVSIGAVGTADALTTAVGVATGTVPASGTADAQTTAVGTLTGTVPVSGTADALTTAVGVASGAIPVSGTADAQTTAVGTLTGSISVSGTADAQSGAVGTLEGTVPISGTADAQTTAVGTATVEGAGVILAYGTADAVTTAVGTASVSIAAVGTADAQATAVGVMEGTVPVSGTADALTTAVGTLTGTIAVSGTADALTTAVGTIEATVSVSGQAGAQSSAVGTLTGIVRISGSAIAQSRTEGKVATPGLFGMIRALLPRTPLWSIVEEKALRWFIEVVGQWVAPVRDFFDEIWLDAFPATTREIVAWEAVQGVRESGLTEAERRTRFAGWLRAQGGQDPRYIQDVLQAAGYLVYVFDWWSDDTPTARNPVETLGFVELGCGDDEMECGNDIAECGATKGGDGYALVNKLYRVGPNYTTGCGEDHMECGDDSAECGDYDGLEFVRIEYIIPTDPVYWPYFMYIAGPGFTQLNIPASRRDHFEDLILSLCPEHLWIGLLVNYVSGYIYEDESGDYLTEDESGDYLYEVTQW